MKLNIIAVVMMILAIAVGKMIGGVLVDMFGGTIGGSIFGTLIIGFVCYFVYNIVAGGKFNIASGLFFAVLVFFADLIAGWIAGYINIGGSELILYGLTGAIMALLWSYIGGKTASTTLRKIR